MNAKAASALHSPWHRITGWLPLVAMAATVALCAHVIAGPFGTAAFSAILLAVFLLGPRVPVPIAMRLMGAIPLDPWMAPELRRLVANIADRADLPATPVVYRLPTVAPNAFAVGDTAMSGVAVSDGLMQLLSARELAGVLAHEIAHLAAGDTARLRLAEIMARIAHALALTGILAAAAVVLLAPSQAAPAWLPILLAFVPSGMLLLQLALSRSREFAADAEAAALTGDPVALATALAKVEAVTRPALAFLLPARRQPPTFLRSHPTTRERIARLSRLAGMPPA